MMDRSSRSARQALAPHPPFEAGSLVIVRWIALFMLAAAMIASCRGDPSLFDFADAVKIMPYIYYDDSSVPLEERTSIRAWVHLEARYQDWPLRWTTDETAMIHETEKWKDYDPERGIFLLNRCVLRAFAGNAEGTLITAVARKEFPLRESSSVSFFAAPGGTGDGLSPESPMGSVQAAVDEASARWIAGGSTGPRVLVRVKSGTFQEHLTLKPGVDIDGSYGPSWEPPYFGEGWTPSTTILAPSYNGSTMSVSDPVMADPSWALRIPSNIGAAYLSALRFRGFGSGLYGAAALVECSPVDALPGVVLQRCFLEPGGAASSAAAWVRGGTGTPAVEFRDSWLISSTDSSSAQSLAMGLLAVDASVLLSGRCKVNAGPPSSYPYPMENEVYGIRAVRSSSSLPQPLASLSGSVFVIAKGNVSTRLAVGAELDGAALRMEGDCTIQSADAQAGGSDPTGVSCALWLHSRMGLDSFATLRGGTLKSGWAVDRYGSAPGSQPDFDPGSAAFSAGLLIQDGAGLDMEGVGVHAGDSPWLSVGIVARGLPASLRVSRSYVSGGSVNGGFSAGMALSLDDYPTLGPSLLIDASRLWGGNQKAGGGYLRGLWGRSLGPWDADLVLRNCLVHAGRPFYDEASSSWSGSPAGVVLQAAANGGAGSIGILNDTVLAMRGGQAVALSLAGNVTPRIVNSIFLSDEWAVTAWPDLAARPSQFKNNILFSTVDLAYLNNGSTPALTLGELNDPSAANPVTAAAGTAGGNIIAAADAWPATMIAHMTGAPEDEGSLRSYDFRPPEAFTEGGLDISATEGFSLDVLGSPRSAPWSQGAFEKP